jgi:GTP-dependent dephospho-CoA kinase
VLILKKNLMPEFKKPFGKLYTSLDDARISLSEDSILISVGDVTTRNLLDSGLVPDIGIVDHKIERKPSESKISYDAVVLHAKNPAGIITDELWKTIKDGLEVVQKSKKHVLIVVDGEEDLSVVPCILESPKNSLILYGQPGEGVVLVEVDRAKHMAEYLIKKFEEVR